MMEMTAVQRAEAFFSLGEEDNRTIGVEDLRQIEGLEAELKELTPDQWMDNFGLEEAELLYKAFPDLKEW